jgi:hypothetical protein
MGYYLTKTCSNGKRLLVLASDKILEQKSLATVVYQICATFMSLTIICLF